MNPNHNLVKRTIVLAITITIGLLLSDSVAFADSPPNLSSDLTWVDSGGTWDPTTGATTASFGSINDIELAFNNARRGEEADLGLTNGCYGNLSLPSGFMAYSASRRAYILINAERQARATMCGTDSAVIGKPLEEPETNITNLAQYYADYVVDNNATGHNADGTTPFERIDNDPVIGVDACGGTDGHQFLPRSENIAYFWTSESTNPMPVERAVFAWIYASSASAFGHREAVLLQDTAVNGASGYTDDYGSSGQEGFIGIGIAESPSYDPFNFGWVNQGTVVVLKIFDPQPESVGCAYEFEDPTAVGLGAISADATNLSRYLPLSVWLFLLITITALIPKPKSN